MTAVASTNEPILQEIAAPPAAKKRKRTPILVAALTFTAVSVAGGYWALNRGLESTDDAQVEGRVMNVSARVSGQVSKVHVTDNQQVEAGDVLVELDPRDYAAKVDVARADLAAARASVAGARSTLDLTEKTAPANLVQAEGAMTAASSQVVSASAAIDQAKADVTAAESQRNLAQLNFNRAKTLVDDKAVAQVELDTQQNELDGATARLDQARARLASSEALRSGTGGGVTLAKGRLSAAQTASEQLAAARAALALAEARALQMEAALHLAELNLSYTRLLAPRRGIVSRRSVEEGQMVSPEHPLFAIVPKDDVWVVANFKEDQLASMHAGQAATVRIDTYGRREFQGKVDSVAGGTGARFALLPPYNATGNFVKVVQRVPVLIRIDPAAGVDLRPGMSADVTVRVQAK